MHTNLERRTIDEWTKKEAPLMRQTTKACRKLRITRFKLAENHQLFVNLLTQEKNDQQMELWSTQCRHQQLRVTNRKIYSEELEHFPQAKEVFVSRLDTNLGQRSRTVSFPEELKRGMPGQQNKTPLLGLFSQVSDDKQKLIRINIRIQGFICRDIFMSLTNIDLSVNSIRIMKI